MSSALSDDDKKKPREQKVPSSSSSSSSSDDDEHDPNPSSSDEARSSKVDKVKIQLDHLQQFFAHKFGFARDDADSSDSHVLKKPDFTELVNHWKNNGFKNIITMVGAGISTSAGIPDFRSPSTGLYNNLQKYNLPHPTAIFELDYFTSNPQPFFTLAKELYPGKFKPTPCHYFIKLLHDKGLLLRHYTQNIDTLERIAGIPSEKLVEAHGTFYTNHCVECRKEYSMEWVKEQIFADNVPTCGQCNGIVKPDIVFFGEDLPRRFYTLPAKDFKKCDLLIIMGTSLEVQPFASLAGRPKRNCVRLLINRDPVGRGSLRYWFSDVEPLRYNEKDNKRDVALLGDCDDGVRQLAKEIGLGDELEELIKTEHKKIDDLDKESDKATKAEAE